MKANTNFANIVIDNGSRRCKAGFAADNVPRTVVTCFLGYPRNGYGTEKIVCSKKLFYCGGWSHRYPSEDGILSERMEYVWKHIFENELNAYPADHPVLLTASSRNSDDIREKMTHIMFEEFNIPALYIADQAALALYASGLTTGIVLKTGHDISQAVPIYEGHALRHSSLHLNLAGQDMTKYLRKVILPTSDSFSLLLFRYLCDQPCSSLGVFFWGPSMILCTNDY